MPIMYKRIEIDKKRHYIIPELGNAQLKSSTSALNIVNKPALVPWAAREAVKYIAGYFKKLMSGEMKFEDLDINEILYGARTAHAKITKEAADIGSIVHDTISDFHIEELTHKHHRYTAGECTEYVTNRSKERITEFIKKDPTVKIPPESENGIKLCLSSFVNWREEVHFEVLETEIVVYSAKWRFAGTLDALGKIYSKLSLADYKSSGGIYVDYYYQVASYRCAYEEMTGKNIEQEWIIRFGKTDGAFDPRLLDDSVGTYKDRLDGFFYALGLSNNHDLLESLEKARVARVRQSDKISAMIPHHDIFGLNKNKIIDGSVLTTDGGETPAANKIPVTTKSKKSKVLF